MDLKKMLRGFASVSLYFLSFVEQNHVEVWPGFQSLLKFLLWTQIVEWVKVLNAFGLFAFGNVFVLGHCQIRTSRAPC